METMLGKYAQLIFKQSFLPILILSPEEKVLACSESFCRLVGYTKDEIYKKVPLGNITLRVWSRSNGELIDRVKRTSRPLQYNEVFLHKSGQFIPTSTCLNIVRDTGNNPLFYYLIVTEISPDKGDAVSRSLYDEFNFPFQRSLKLEDVAREMENDDPQIRMKACTDMVSTQDKGAVPHLIKALGDPIPEVRMSACLSLSEMEAEKAVPSLVDLLRDRSSLVRWGAVTALGRIGGNTTVPALEEALQDSDVDVKNAARDALALMTKNKDSSGD
jgi:PAS domain S-box-containing protein